MNELTDELLESLLRQAGPRPVAPQDIAARVRSGVEAHWEATVADRRRRRLGQLTVAVAASLALAFLTLLKLPPATGPSPALTVSVVRAAGEVMVDGAPLVTDTRLKPGSRLVTGAGRVALRWGAELSLRLDEETTVVRVDDETVHLRSGQLYVDSGNGSDALTIRTKHGRVSHVGTQYLVLAREDRMNALVRSGRISVSLGQAMVFADKGETLEIVTGAETNRGTVEADSERWTWARQIAPPFDADGRTLAQFLDWVARESGLRLRFGSGEARAIASRSTLRGSVTLEPMEALPIVLETSDLRATVTEGTILVDKR
ncbi:MAG: FecR domain-containing protein [Pseudomonadota bacterium]